jgi:hypothetical protein
VQITIQEAGQDLPTIIKHLDCNTAHRSLGVYKTLPGDQTEQQKQISSKSEQISAAVGAAHLNRKETKLAWNAIYTPGVT